jgi:hypothetical protein
MYIKFKLTPGQMAPEGSTGVCLEDGYTVWIGENFNSQARHGRLTPTDPTPADTYIYEEMTEEEINEYNEIITADIEE